MPNPPRALRGRGHRLQRRGALGRPAGDEVLSEGTGYAVINTTRYYTDVCAMTLTVADAEGAAVGGAEIALYIWNEVNDEPPLHSAFESKAGADGTFTFDLGPGDYAVHARKGGAVGWAVATSTPGKPATCAITIGEAPADPDVERDSCTARLGRLPPVRGDRPLQEATCPRGGADCLRLAASVSPGNGVGAWNSGC